MTTNVYAVKSTGGWWKRGIEKPFETPIWSAINPVPFLYHPESCEQISWEEFDRLLPSVQLEYGYVRIQGEVPVASEGDVIVTMGVVDVDGVPFWSASFGPIPTPDLPDDQFAQGLWQAGLISFEECEALVSVGDVPEALQRIVDTLDDEGEGVTPRKEAVLLLKSTRSYPFNTELVDRVRQELGWTAAQMRHAWSAWATL